MHTSKVFELRKTGLDKKTGLFRYRARIVITDSVTKKRAVDTVASKIFADSIGEAREKAEAIAEQKRRELDSGKPIRGDRITIVAAWALWIASVRRAGSLVTWRSIGKRRVIPAMGDRYVHAVTSAEWGEFFERHRLEVSDNYARHIRGSVQSFYKWCIANKVGRVAVNPINASNAFGRGAKKDDPEQRRLYLKGSREEAVKRWLELDEIKPFLAVYRREFPHTYVLWLVMCCVALRFSEAVALEVDAFDLSNPDNPRVHVYQAVSRGKLGPPKNDNDRWLDMPPLLVSPLLARLGMVEPVTFNGAVHSFVFPCLRPRRAHNAPVVSYEAVREHVRESKRLAGISSANATHLARHTAALLTSQLPGTAGMRQLGHATMKQYLDYGAAPRGLVGDAIESQVGPLLPPDGAGGKGAQLRKR